MPHHPITLLQPIGHAGFLITAQSQLIDVVADLSASQITKLLGILELAGNHIHEVVNVQERMRFFERHEDASAGSIAHANHRRTGLCSMGSATEVALTAHPLRTAAGLASGRTTHVSSPTISMKRP